MAEKYKHLKRLNAHDSDGNPWCVYDGYFTDEAIAELLAENKELEDSKHFLLRKVKEYMDENERMKKQVEELRKQVPKWISVNDRLPNEKEQNELLWVAYVRTDNTIKYMYEASFDYETKQFYTENDWGDKTFILPSIWMVVPPPPATEESSAT